MDPRTRSLLRYGMTVGLGLLGILFFFQTRDPMILIFAIIAAVMLNAVLAGPGLFRGGAKEVRVKCRACGALNLEDAKFCSQCGTAF